MLRHTPTDLRRTAYRTHRRVLTSGVDCGLLIVSSDGENQPVIEHSDDYLPDALGRGGTVFEFEHWAGLCHPEDVGRTAKETLGSPTGTMSNRYRHADGHYVTIYWFWYFLPGHTGFSLCTTENTWRWRRAAARLVVQLRETTF